MMILQEEFHDLVKGRNELKAALVSYHNQQWRVDSSHHMPPVGHLPRDEAEERAAQTGQDVGDARKRNSAALTH